jgi:hypothetical protein
LVVVILLAAMLMAILSAYAALTQVESAITRSSIGSTRGYYAAEAGLNLRAEEIRQRFDGFLRPAGVSPLEGGGYTPCSVGNQGSGDFGCRSYAVGGRDVRTFVTESPANPSSMVVPPGEPYEYLNAQKYAFRVHSIAYGPDSRPEAILDLEFNSRLVPIFQFAAFYNKDLEIHPGPPMTLAGPVHSNGDLYLGSSGGLDITGQITTARNIYQGRKTDEACYAGGVRVSDPATLTSLPACPSTNLVLYTPPDFTPWNGMIRTGVDPLTVPPPESFDAVPGAFYWDRADVRIKLKLDGGTPGVELRQQDDSPDASGTATLTSCTTGSNPAVDRSSSFFNLREGKSIELLEINVVSLLNCLHQNSGLMGGKTLDETSEGGLVWYLSVDGPDSAGFNGYGVRLTGGGELAATTGSPPAIAGLTVVSDQAIYIQGDFNAVNKRPAAVIADSLNVLSDAYVDGEHSLALTDSDRKASTTTINAAFLAGTDVTGNQEGPGGQGGAYNGGLENYPRLHEHWGGVTLRYRGSFVSLNAPNHVNGPHTTPGLYSPPVRDWGFDTDFNDAANLPPLTPRFVYLRQDLFVRQFEY